MISSLKNIIICTEKTTQKREENSASTKWCINITTTFQAIVGEHEEKERNPHTQSLIAPATPPPLVIKQAKISFFIYISFISCFFIGKEKVLPKLCGSKNERKSTQRKK